MNKFILTTKAIIFAFALLSSPIQADTTIYAVGVTSKNLGYNNLGYGVQLRTSERFNNWGWDAEITALSHAKISGVGQRYQAIGMGRRFFGDHFVEAGVEWGGYTTEFPDGSTWTKYGYAPAVGIGTTQSDIEWRLRYIAPDSTPNNTSITIASVDAPITKSWTTGVTVEYWRFDLSEERRSGTHIMFRAGWKF